MAICKYQTKQGTRYRYTIYRKDQITGERRDISKRGFTSKRSALSAEAVVIRELEQQELMGIDINITMNQLFEFWLEKRKREGVKKQTLENSRIRYNNAFRNTIGSLKVRSINFTKLQELVDAITPNYTNLKNHISQLKAVLEIAVPFIIPANPMKNVSVDDNKLKPKEDKQVFMTKAELRQFFEEFLELCQKGANIYDRQFSQDKLILTLFCYTGMRIGEVLALQWEDLDFQKKELTINKTQAEIKGKVEISTPKTHYSIRKIPIASEYLLKLFADWKVEQKNLQKIYGCKKEFEGKMFYNVGRKAHYTIRAINNKIKTMLNGKITSHAFRHTLITLLEEADCHSKKLSIYVGHDVQDKNMTNHYTHLGPDYLREIATQIDEIITPIVKIGE